MIEAFVDGRPDPRPLTTSTNPLEDTVEKGIEHRLGDGRATETKILVKP
ncbi:hypothetical protein SAMN04489752_2559 [Brevibacterium siliguriense]|uniref:Zinc-binding dehydrogenase n=1 Tax=Brevibacterium siliguriense TaxID=1136497 RepID=A0A1H1V7A4_9MICO|nr:hypothetical protein SAMN04489752_2559 [Brevibacterium siliguriense]